MKSKNKNRFIFLVTSLFLVIFFNSFAEADQPQVGPFQQNKNAILTQVCDNCTYVNITTVQLPRNGGIVTINSAMTKTGQTYNYTFTQTSSLGDYIYTTCGNPDGVLTCQSVDFLVTPSGSQNILGLFILVIVGIYSIAFIGFFGRNIWVSIFGGMAMIILGLFTLNNGIDIFRNTITEVFSWTTIGLGAFFSIYPGMELIRENL